MAKGKPRKPAGKQKQPSEAKKRPYTSQSDVPRYPLRDAIRIPQTIADNYGKSPTRPLAIAQALGLAPNSSHFRMLCGAAMAFGLTDGAWNTTKISLTALGRRVVAPTKEGDDLAAKQEALLTPKVVREFLSKYDGSKVPQPNIAKNVLEEMEVPADSIERTFDLIVQGARDLGLLREVKGNDYVDLQGVSAHHETEGTAPELRAEVEGKETSTSTQEEVQTKAPAAQAQHTARKTRVFITHGKNKQILQQLKELLAFGNFEPVVCEEQETVSKPVPDKVMDDMRTCDAGVIHVGSEMKLLDEHGNAHTFLNQNVLIEIGAALALYARRFILLVESGVKLPSNLQGLYEVRYEGDKLEYEATMKLLKAFSGFRQ